MSLGTDSGDVTGPRVLARRSAQSLLLLAHILG